MRVLMFLAAVAFMMEAPASHRPAHMKTSAGSISNTSRQSSMRDPHFPSMDEVAASAGLRPLKETSLPSGTRELRLWFGGGIGWPQDLFRFQMKNGSVTGQWIRYWSVAVDEDAPPEAAAFGAIVEYSLAGRCDSIRTLDRTAVCFARFAKRPDWNALLEKIESEGVWKLPDEGDLPKEHFPNGMQVIISDGYGMTVEARNGENYRRYGYDNPEHREKDEAKHAAAITAAFKTIESLVPPNAHTRTFRGRYTPSPKAGRFINCGDTVTWGLSLQGVAPPLPRFSPGDSLVDTLRSAYVEVRGMKAFSGLAKQWESPYPEIIEADTMLVIKPWRPQECR
jgi:hypothetical protein